MDGFRGLSGTGLRRLYRSYLRPAALVSSTARNGCSQTAGSGTSLSRDPLERKRATLVGVLRISRAGLLIMTMIALAMVLTQSVGLADVRSCTALVVTSPRDGWRLTVNPDGSARVNYAALPQTLEVPPHTFDLLQLHSSLSTRVDSNPARVDSGTVECRRLGTAVQAPPTYLDDDLFIAQLFERAWETAPEPSDSIDKEHVDTLRTMWDRRARPR
jgi:hypothetical protein